MVTEPLPVRLRELAGRQGTIDQSITYAEDAALIREAADRIDQLDGNCACDMSAMYESELRRVVGRALNLLEPHPLSIEKFEALESQIITYLLSIDKDHLRHGDAAATLIRLTVETLAS